MISKQDGPLTPHFSWFTMPYLIKPWSWYNIKKGKVIPTQAVEALRVARGWGSNIFRHSAHRWRQGCQPYAPAAFYPPGRFLVLISVRGWVDPQGHSAAGNLKKSTLSGTRTGDLSACSIVLNQLRYHKKTLKKQLIDEDSGRPCRQLGRLIAAFSPQRIGLNRRWS
jgi:hypothetical protein